jgi:hypothetical protein
MNLSPRYTEQKWKAAFIVGDWNAAIDIAEDRIRGRWLDAADKLIDEPYSGFAMVALDCIILESLWGFKNGKPVPQGGERQVYRDILAGSTFGWKDVECDSFRDFVRNGLMHDAETRGGWLVEKTVPRDAIAKKNKNGNYVLNRTKFHKAITAAFEEWLLNLRAGDPVLRQNMRDRMNQIISKHYTV